MTKNDIDKERHFSKRQKKDSDRERQCLKVHFSKWQKKDSDKERQWLKNIYTLAKDK